MARRRRRARGYLSPTRRVSSPLLSTPAAKRRGGRRRGSFAPRRKRRGGSSPLLAGSLAVLVVVAAGAGFMWWRAGQSADQRRVDAVAAFARAWTRGDLTAMWKQTGGRTRPELNAFKRAYGQAYQAAGVEATRVGKPSELRGATITVPVRMRTRDFGELRGRVRIRTLDEDDRGSVEWQPGLRLPGLREEETPRRRAGADPVRGDVLAADGSRLADDPIGSGIAGVPAAAGEPGTGLERIYDRRLGGRAPSTLRFGRRVIKRVPGVRGRNVQTTIRTGLSRSAQAALGNRQAGVAVIRPSDGSVLALAGLAVSAPQPPGSTFKIITLAAGLASGDAKMSDSFPVRSSATLSGVQINNAGGGGCGGSLATSFVKSCNSVFAPLGAKIGARKLVSMAERFGFNEPLRVPAAETPKMSSARELADDLAIGSAAIGQERDLATPLAMASVGATIANRGVRVAPRIVRSDRKQRRRVVSRRVAATVRDLMVQSVRSGTGTAAALGGVAVAGKTGTAELVAQAPGQSKPENETGWFVGFAPASGADVAVAVMVVGGGAGGTSAAPIARRVLSAAL